MSVHTVETREDGHKTYYIACTGCTWRSDYSWRLAWGLAPSLHGTPRVEPLTLLRELAERDHLTDPALSGEMVVIASARLTRRDASFVGKLGDKRVVIAQSEHGLWSLYLNDTGIQLIKTWFERVSEVVRASQRYTNDTFA